MLDHGKCGIKLKLSVMRVHSCVVLVVSVVAMPTGVRNQSKAEGKLLYDFDLLQVNTPIDFSMVIKIFLTLDQFMPLLFDLGYLGMNIVL